MLDLCLHAIVIALWVTQVYPIVRELLWMHEHPHQIPPTHDHRDVRNTVRLGIPAAGQFPLTDPAIHARKVQLWKRVVWTTLPMVACVSYVRTFFAIHRALDRLRTEAWQRGPPKHCEENQPDYSWSDLMFADERSFQKECQEYLAAKHMDSTWPGFGEVWIHTFLTPLSTIADILGEALSAFAQHFSTLVVIAIPVALLAMVFLCPGHLPFIRTAGWRHRRAYEEEGHRVPIPEQMPFHLLVHMQQQQQQGKSFLSAPTNPLLLADYSHTSTPSSGF